MDRDFLLFLLVATLVMAAHVAFQGWALGWRLRGGGFPRWGARPPDLASAVPRFFARHAWPLGGAAAVMYVAGVSGVALHATLPWGILAFLGLALGAAVGSGVVTVRTLEKNRAALDAPPRVAWQPRIGLALVVGAAWTGGMVALSLATDWLPMPDVMLAGVSVYAAVLGIVGLALLKRSRDEAARRQ